MSVRSQRSSTISPFRSRGSPVAVPTKRPGTPSTVTSSRPSSRSSASPATSCSPLPCSIPSPSSIERSAAASITVAVTTKSKENITVTVRFRPLSPREISNGDEIAWYADGDYTIRNEYNPSSCYGFDRVFGPATTTRRVYDVAAQHVVSGAMQGINGTVFAYGVTSSGKTHTMRGEQRSPGVIPLAVKDVFGIIQETPEREYLLRVSYLEIYNEVINDLLDPTGQNLRIREDSQGTYVEGIKEEVVLSPAHALSLIASGEEHRHVGSNNFNLLSSRSHTIFTLTIESSPHGNGEEEDVTLSQLHLIDLAGSESSKAETSGLRRKEGSYINKSLLTLGTVISKLTDAKAIHIPYRDSKLTRLLQPTLSGHGRVSLICTITPASSNSEETHNTLKFAQRCKRVEIKASQNKIMDEKSLIKKYQKEISCLKEELQQLRHGMSASTSNQEDLVSLKLQLEAGQVKLQSRLEEEEEAKAALMGRIQRLTKLILVSTKNSMQSNIVEKSVHKWRHSFGEDELAYLPDRRRENMVNDDTRSIVSEFSAEARDEAHNLDEMAKDLKTNKTRGMLSWLKLKKPANLAGMSPSSDNQSPVSAQSASSSTCSQRKPIGRRENPTAITLAGDLFTATVGAEDPTPTGTTIADQMDLLHEQMKMLVGEVALHFSSLKRLSEQAACDTEDSQLRDQIQNLKDEIREKKHQICVLEQQMIGSFGMTPHNTNPLEMSQALLKLTMQLNEKIFELEIKSADNRILQEQLQMTKSDNTEMQETILLLRQQLSSLSVRNSAYPQQVAGKESLGKKAAHTINSGELETHLDVATPTSVMSLNGIFSQDHSKEIRDEALLRSQALEIENLKQEKMRLTEEKDGLEVQNKKLAEEASYAKELASAAAVELRNMAEEITKLCHENAKLADENSRSCCCQRSPPYSFRQNSSSNHC